MFSAIGTPIDAAGGKQPDVGIVRVLPRRAVLKPASQGRWQVLIAGAFRARRFAEKRQAPNYRQVRRFGGEECGDFRHRREA